MITINLKPGIKRQAPKGQNFAAGMTWFKGLGQRVKDPTLAIAVAAWVVVLGGLGFFWVRTSSQLRTLEPELQTTQSEYDRYRNFVLAKRREERVRDSIMTQIGTIAAVDQERFVWPHMLDEIGAALPDFTWLTEISTLPAAIDADSSGGAPVNIRIVGRTRDLQNYTAFLRRLEESPWLANVLPVEAKTVIERNQPLTSFTIQASFSRADSSRIRTAPILESTGR